VVQELLNSRRQPVDVLHGGTGRGFLPFDQDPGEYAIMRKQLRPVDDSQVETVLETPA